MTGDQILAELKTIAERTEHGLQSQVAAAEVLCAGTRLMELDPATLNDPAVWAQVPEQLRAPMVHGLVVLAAAAAAKLY